MDDPLLASIISLHSVQEALQQEIRQLREIGNGNGRETEVEYLNERGRALESQLEHIWSVLSSKESRVNELEAGLTRNMEGPGPGVGAVLFLLDKRRDMDMELETVFKLRIEAEVEYVAVLSFALEAKDRMLLLGPQRQMLHKLADAERKAFLLKSKAEGLQASFEELLDAEEVLKLQNQVHRHTLWFFYSIDVVAASVSSPAIFGLHVRLCPHLGQR